MSLLADQLIAMLTIDQEVTWTPSGLNLDAASFHDFATDAQKRGQVLQSYIALQDLAPWPWPR